MPINTIALIAGSLSFTVGLAWNRAISDTLTEITNGRISHIAKGCIITLIVILTVFIINIIINIYQKIFNTEIHDSIKDIGNNKNNKVKLFL